MLHLCCTEKDLPLTFPINQNIILVFIAWADSRGLCASTINSYLSALRQLHLSLDIPIPVIRSDLVHQILLGKKNSDSSAPKHRPIRIPVTPSILRILKLKIRLDNDLPQADKLVYWLVCTLAFHGSFRMGELLSKSPISFDPRYSLLGRDVNLKKTLINSQPYNFLEISLSSTKTSTTSTTIIDVFSTNSDICPIRAFNKLPTAQPDLPFFRLSNGKSLTPSVLNLNLRKWLGDTLDFSKTTVSGHSFRAGLVSVLGSLGFADDDIKSVGRWSSRAFLLYTKLPRTRRLAMAKALGDLNLRHRWSTPFSDNPYSMDSLLYKFTNLYSSPSPLYPLAGQTNPSF